MTVSEDILRRIVDQIVQAEPDRVILFGSAATGTMTADSDLDCFSSSRRSRIRPRSVRLRTALENVPLPVDVIVMSRQRFEKTKDVIGGIAYPAHKYGRIVYEAA